MSDHKRWVSEVFDRAASQYGEQSCSFFNYFGKRLVEQVNVVLNQHTLDVATGRGAILFPLAEAVGPLGKVVGIDISQQMLKETSKELLQRNMHWVELQCMDAENLNFPDDCFDIVFCGFALFFFPSIPKALSEFKRVLKAEGTLAVSIWGKDSELHAWKNEEIRKLCSINSLFATPLKKEEELRRLLEACFSEVHIFEETKIFTYSTPEEWWDSLWNHGTRAQFEQLSPDQIARLQEKALKKASSLDKGQGIPEARQVFYGIAKKG